MWSEPKNDKDLLTYLEAARICGWKTAQPIRRAIRRRQLPVIKFTHKSRKIRRRDLEAWLASKTVRSVKNFSLSVIKNS